MNLTNQITSKLFKALTFSAAMLLGSAYGDEFKETNETKESKGKDALAKDENIVKHANCNLVIIPEHNMEGLVEKVLTSKGYFVKIENKIIPNSMYMTVHERTYIGLFHSVKVSILDSGIETIKIVFDKKKLSMFNHEDILTKLIPACKIIAPVAAPDTASVAMVVAETQK